MILRILLGLIAVITIAFPAHAEDVVDEDLLKKQSLCRSYVERAVPDYAQGGVPGLIKKGEEGVYCTPLFPITDALPDEQFLKLKNDLFESCIESKEMTEERIKEVISRIPEGC